VYIFLHNKEDIVLPSFTGLFGSTHRKIRVLQARTHGFYQDFEILKTSLNNLDHGPLNYTDKGLR
jgi:hypothetical protein